MITDYRELQIGAIVVADRDSSLFYRKKGKLPTEFKVKKGDAFIFLGHRFYLHSHNQYTDKDCVIKLFSSPLNPQEFIVNRETPYSKSLPADFQTSNFALVNFSLVQSEAASNDQEPE